MNNDRCVKYIKLNLKSTYTNTHPLTQTYIHTNTLRHGIFVLSMMSLQKRTSRVVIGLLLTTFIMFVSYIQNMGRSYIDKFDREVNFVEDS